MYNLDTNSTDWLYRLMYMRQCRLSLQTWKAAQVVFVFLHQDETFYGAEILYDWWIGQHSACFAAEEFVMDAQKGPVLRIEIYQYICK